MRGYFRSLVLASVRVPVHVRLRNARITRHVDASCISCKASVSFRAKQRGLAEYNRIVMWLLTCLTGVLQVCLGVPISARHQGSRATCKNRTATGSVQRTVLSCLLGHLLPCRDRHTSTRVTRHLQGIVAQDAALPSVLPRATIDSTLLRCCNLATCTLHCQ